jgi:hypothetical protein
MLSFNIAPVNSKEDLVAAKSQAMHAISEHDKLAKEVHHLNLMLETIWTLLKSKTDLTEDELKKELTAVKLKRAEAAVNAEPDTCTNCGKAIAKESTKCVFCGTVQNKEKLF